MSKNAASRTSVHDINAVRAKRDDAVRSILNRDELLAMFANLSGIPPNHHGRVDRVEGSKVWVEFPIDGSYEHSQVAPYDIEKVAKR